MLMRKSFSAEIFMLLLITVGCFCILFKRVYVCTDVDPDNTQVLTTPLLHTRKSLINLQVHLRTTTGQDFVTDCEQNTSAANIAGFSTLPGRIQDFFYYQHCRKFRMLLDVPDLCGATLQESANVFLLLVIKSTPLNYERREVLRKTWAKERLQNGAWIRRVFISGTAGVGEEKTELNKLMELENQENKDILQWDFTDTFINLTLKQVLFLDWMQKRCPYARFLLNGDDDVFANTDNMVEYLQSLSDNNGDKHLFVGALNLFMPVIRDSWSKYFVPVQMYKLDSFPPYCGGGGFLLSGFTAKVIYNMSHSIPLLPIDDAYMGMCLEKAGLKPTSHFGMRTLGLNIPSKMAEDAKDPCYFREIMLVHRFMPPQIFSVWHKIHDPNLMCTTSENSKI